MNTHQIIKKYNILINFGGSDEDNFTMHVLNILINSELQQLVNKRILKRLSI